jgi:stage III sporulation protein AG
MKQDKEAEKESNSWIKKQFFKDNQSNHKKGKYIYLIVVLTLGTMIMLISNLFINNESSQNALPTFNNNGDNQSKEDVETFGKKDSTGNNLIRDYELAYEAQLKEALDTIVGVSDVTVVVNVDATEKQVLEKNRKSQTQLTDETDREGGKRKVEDQSTDEQLVIIQNGEKEVPIVVETKKPAIRGVLVVAKGADNIQVKKWIVEAVTRSLDVPSHRVSVLPKKTKGES